MPNVGPGSYDNAKEINRKIPNPTIPRDKNNSFIGEVTSKRKNKGSIKQNFEEDTETESDEDGGH